MAFFGGNDGRTERATPKRRGESRKKGQIGRSQQLAPAVVFLGLIWLLSIYGVSLTHQLSGMLQRILSSAGPADLTAENLQKLFISCFSEVSGSLFLLAGASLVFSVSANAAQGGLVLSGHRLGFHLENLNVTSGAKRLLPGNSIGELLKALGTIGVVSYFAWAAYSGVLADLPRYVLLDPLESSSQIVRIVTRLGLKIGVILVVIAIADYLWKRRQFEQSIKMTKQEVKDEARNAEIAPEVRSKIRKRQREVALRSMMADVRKADVIITNPTHFAVALRYQPEKMTAPTVVAKGKGYVALKIKEIAAANRIPLVENKPLAQTLFKAVTVGQQIPSSLFKAVAEVLAYVYRLKQIRL